MSAVSNLTYVVLIDKDSVDPQLGNSQIVFNNYDEAMSYTKWVSVLYTNVFPLVWNYNGGSGYWSNGTWYPRANTNWP